MTTSQLLRAKKLSAAKLAKLLESYGFEDTKNSLRSLTEILGDKARSKPFLAIADRFFDLAAASPDPDRTLLNLDRFLAARGKLNHINFKNPRSLELLVKTFSISQALSDALVNAPELF